jgi:hypothetical protein
LLSSSKNRTLKALPSFFDSAATNLLKQAWEFDLSLSQAPCFVFCFFAGMKKAALWGGSFEFWYPKWESNPHSLRNTSLSRARLPVPPFGQMGTTKVM